MASTTLPDVKPCALPVLFDNFPDEVTTKKQWVLWRYVWRDNLDGTGAWTKPPLQPNGYEADTTDPTTWRSFETVKAQYLRAKNFDGIGFVFNDDYTGIDIDGSTDVETLVVAINSYAELSPSGNGVHIITRGAVGDPQMEGGRRNGNLEMYYRGRFFAMTGHKLDYAASTMADTNGIVHDTYENMPIKPAQQPLQLNQPQNATEIPANDKRRVLDAFRLQELLARNNGFAKLWRGDWKGYQSASEGVYGLLADIAAITRFDRDATLSLFKQSPFYATNPKKYNRTLQNYDIDGAFQLLTTRLAQQLTKPLHSIPVLTEDQANQLKAPEWVLEGIIVKGQITVISGKKGSFKTFEAIHQTLKVAQSMNTLYIAAEDPIGVGLRRQAWRKHYNCNTGVMLTIPQPVKFHDPQEVINLLDIITLYSISHVTIDTIAACSRGLNENAADDMGRVLEGLETIRDQSGVNMLVLAHESSKNPNGIRGWSGVGDASYVELSSQRQEKSNVVTLKSVRVKLALEEDYTHTLIEVDNTLVVTEIKPVFKYSELPKDRVKLRPRDIALLTAIAANGSHGLTRNAIMQQFAPAIEQQGSIKTGLNVLKRDHSFIAQDKQGTPYVATNAGLAWLQELEQD